MREPVLTAYADGSLEEGWSGVRLTIRPRPEPGDEVTIFTSNRFPWVDGVLDARAVQHQLNMALAFYRDGRDALCEVEVRR